MEEERCQCPEDEISVNDLIVHGYNLSTSTHRVCGKVHYMFAGKQRGTGGLSRGVDSESPKPEETRVNIDTAATETANEVLHTMRQCSSCKKIWPLELNFNYCGGCGLKIIWE